MEDENEQRLFVRLEDKDSEDTSNQEIEETDTVGNNVNNNGEEQNTNNYEEDIPEQEEEIIQNRNEDTRVLRDRKKIKRSEKLSAS